METSLRQEARDSLAGTVGLESSMRQEASDSLAGTVGLELSPYTLFNYLTVSGCLQHLVVFDKCSGNDLIFDFVLT